MTSSLSWGERIRTLRKRLSLDQDQMGQELGLSREWVSKLETGKEEPSERVQLKVEKIARERGLHFSESGFTVAAQSASPVIVGEGATEELREFSFRLKTAVHDRGIHAADLAASMGVPLDRVDEWLKGQRLPRAADLRRAAEALGVSVDWLQRGEGLRTHAVTEDPQMPYGVIPLSREVGVVSWSHAGEAATYEELPKDWREKVATTSRDRRAFGVVVEGDCMEPKYLNGDILIIEPSHEPRNGKAVVAKLKDDAVQVRIYTKMPNGKIRLATMKPDIYPTLDHTLGDFHWIWPVHSMVRKE